MLRRTLIALLLPVLILPGFIPDDISLNTSSYEALSSASDSSNEPDGFSVLAFVDRSPSRLPVFSSFTVIESFHPITAIPVKGLNNRAPPAI